MMCYVTAVFLIWNVITIEQSLTFLNSVKTPEGRSRKEILIMAKIDENTVAAKGQLQPNDFVTFEHLENQGLRVMFVGNSITRHGIAHNIGWHWDWGMAASAKEKDYVHRVISDVQKIRPDAAFCLCQVAEWERTYKTGEEVLPKYAAAAAFQADIIVVRMIENATVLPEDWDSFKAACGRLIRYLDPQGSAKVLITTSFWKHKGDGALRQFAEENNIPLVELGDLGELDEMKAVGLFEHRGVAAHPGDLGMEHIAKRIFDGISSWL